MTLKHRVETSLAPAPRPQFSQGVRKGPVLQTAGQVGTDPVTGDYADGIAAQTVQVLRNLNAVLEAGGATFDDVVMLRVFLADAGDFAQMNEAYDGFVPQHTPSGILPARTTVVTGFAAPQILVEIDALAVLSPAPSWADEVGTRVQQ
ncbi:MAG TPA: RidA family protein [Pseudolysinimonas sp.]|nr:RidA family protein [Pseudolysinimonas sp.]